MPTAVIVAGARTPIGRMSGAFAEVSAVELGGVAIRGAIDRAGIKAAGVAYVIMAQVMQAVREHMPPRRAPRAARLPTSVPALPTTTASLSAWGAIR